MRLRHYLLMLAFIAIVITSLSMVSDEAQADAHYWAGTAGASAGTPGNWNPVITNWATSDLYWGASANGCAYNLTTTVQSWHILANYTGVITQGSVDFGIGTGGYTQAGATFTANNQRNITCDGSWTFNAGTTTTSKVKLTMTRDGSTVRFGPVSLYALTANANITLSGSSSYFNIESSFKNNGKTVTIANGLQIIVQAYTGFTWTNTGTLAGTGTGNVLFRIYNSDQTITFGSITCPVTIDGHPSMATGRLCILGANTNFGALTMFSNDATDTITLNLNGKSLAVSGSVTVSTRGAIMSSTPGSVLNANSFTIAATGAIYATNITSISCTANWDSSAGTWTPGNSIVNMTDDNRTVKLASGQSFHALNIVSDSLTPKWIMDGLGGTLYWNVTGLTPNRPYSYRLDNSLQSPLTADGSGNIAMSRSAWSIHTYDLRLIPAITTEPDLSVAEMVAYLASFTADQAVTWTVAGDATFLSFVGPDLGGTPTNLNVGVLSVSVSGSNVNGIAYYNYSLTVTNIAPVISSSPATSVLSSSLYEYQLNVTDLEYGVVLAFSSDSDDLEMYPSGLVHGTISTSGTVHVSVMADDQNGGIAWQNWTIEVTAQTEPGNDHDNIIDGDDSPGLLRTTGKGGYMVQVLIIATLSLLTLIVVAMIITPSKKRRK